jgi:ribose transport system permease protein
MLKVLRTRALERNAGLALGYLVFIAMAAFYLISASSQGELNFYSVQSIFNNAMPLVLVAIGQSFVILTGGIDLSVGAVVSVANCLAAAHMRDSVSSMLLWSVLVILVGCAAGLLNGLFVAFGRLQAIVVTLATLSIGTGVALLILAQPGGQIPTGYVSLLTGSVGGAIPNAAVAVVVLVIVIAVFRRTRLAISLYAIGGDSNSARANGVSVRSATVAAYVLCGMFAALGGLYLSAVANTGDPNAGTTFTLTSIAAVVLGGMSLAGGKGSAAGAIAGAFVLTLIVNVLFLAGVSPWLEDFFQGLVLIVALAANVLLTRLVASTPTSAGELKGAVG